jgi:cobalamin synthase
MKTQYEKVFVAHVAVKLAKAKSLGINASWTSANHLDALAATIEDAIGQAGNPNPAVDIIRDVLGECYNISAYQQALAKKFAAAKSPHFQREEKKTASQNLDDALAQLAAQG